jgi:hypothetical protein
MRPARSNTILTSGAVSIGAARLNEHEVTDMHQQALQAYEAAKFTCNRTDAFILLVVAELVTGNLFGFRGDLLSYRERYSPQWIRGLSDRWDLPCEPPGAIAGSHGADGSAPHVHRSSLHPVGDLSRGQPGEPSSRSTARSARTRAATPFGVRPERTSSTIRRRNSGAMALGNWQHIPLK